jgi:hypothetical protein
VFKNRNPRIIFVSRRDKIIRAEEKYIMRSFINCTSLQTQL